MSQTFLSWSKQLEYACAHVGQFGVYVNATSAFEDPSHTELVEKLQVIQKEYGAHFFASAMLNGDMAMFDTKEEAFKYYSIFDEAPLADSCVYACIISPTEGCLTENT